MIKSTGDQKGGKKRMRKLEDLLHDVDETDQDGEKNGKRRDEMNSYFLEDLEGQNTQNSKPTINTINTSQESPNDHRVSAKKSQKSEKINFSILANFT